MRNLTRRLVAGFMLWLPCAALDRSVSAEPVLLPVGEETRVDDGSVFPGFSAVDGVPGGGFVVVWEGAGIEARRLDADGQALGAVFSVKPPGLFSLFVRPAVAVGDSGSFVVSWDECPTCLAYLPSARARARSFDSLGDALATDLALLPDPSFGFPGTGVTSLADGGALVTWPGESAEGVGAIRVQLIGAGGLAVGASSPVSEGPLSEAGIQPQVAVNGDGTTTFLWASGDGLASRSFASDGTPLGPEAPLTTSPEGLQDHDPVLGVRGDGSFVVVWERAPSSFARSDVLARVLDSDGAPLASEFQVSGETLDDLRYMDAAVSESGDFLVVWTRLTSDDDLLIDARAFASDGAPIGAQFTVASEAVAPAVGAGHAGSFLVSWIADDGLRTQGFQVFASVFANGFESGQLTDWSSWIGASF